MPGPDKADRPAHPLEQARDRGAITLAQFLKVCGAADTGGQAKMLIREGQVQVNGEAEDRPGRHLGKGDRVEVAGQTYSVDR